MLKQLQEWVIAEISENPEVLALLPHGTLDVMIAGETIPSKPGVYVVAKTATRRMAGWSTAVVVITVVHTSRDACCAIMEKVHNATEYEGGRPRTFKVMPKTKNLRMRYCRRTGETFPDAESPEDTMNSGTLTYEVVGCSTTEN